MNTGALKIVIVIVVFFLVVSTAGCSGTGTTVSRYQNPNLCHGSLQNLTFAKAICRQFSTPAQNGTVNGSSMVSP